MVVYLKSYLTEKQPMGKPIVRKIKIGALILLLYRQILIAVYIKLIRTNIYTRRFHSSMQSTARLSPSSVKTLIK